MSASLQLCFESPEYKQLNANQSMKIHKIDINIDNLIADIEKHYRTEYLYLAQSKKDEYARQNSLKENIVQEYKTF